MMSKLGGGEMVGKDKQKGLRAMKREGTGRLEAGMERSDGSCLP